MKSTQSFTVRASGVLAASLSLAVTCGGCGSDTREVKGPPAQKPVAKAPSPPARTAAAEAIGSGKLRGELSLAKERVTAVNAALAQLTDPATADVQTPFNKYSDAVASLQAQAENMKRESAAMRESRSEYFAGWEQKVADIDNPTIRASAEARRSRLRDAQERLTTKAGDVRDAYEPYMRDLQDVRKFLAGDLSKPNVALVADAATKTRESGAVLNQKLDALIAEIDALDGGTGA